MRTEPHARAQFIELTQAIPDRLAIGSFGEAGSGKTEFGVTMPDPIGVIPLDRKTRPRLQKANQKYGKKLLFPKEDFIRHKDPMKLSLMKPEAAIAYYEDHLARIQDAIFTLAEREDVQSVMIDPGTQLWEDVLMKHFGRTYRIMPRDRGPANADMRDVFNALQGKHLLITHQASEIWRNDKPTGKFEWAGWSKLDYYTNLVLEHRYNEQSHEFSVTVRLCQERPDLIGETILTGEDITFDMLAAFVYPDGQW